MWCLVLRCEGNRWKVYMMQFEKENDLYVTNSMWMTFVTMTTVGYGLSLLRLPPHPPARP